MGTTRLTNGEKYTFGKVNGSPVFDRGGDFVSGLEVHKELIIKGSGNDNSAGAGSGNGDGILKTYSNSGKANLMTGYDWTSSGGPLLKLAGPTTSTGHVNANACMEFNAGGGSWCMGTESATKIFGLSYSTVFRPSLNCVWQIDPGNYHHMSFGKAGGPNGSYQYIFRGPYGASTTQNSHPYYMMGLMLDYSGDQNDGNGFRMRMTSKDSADVGITTNRTFLYMSNTAAASYSQGYIKPKGRTTRGVNYSSASDKRLKENIVNTRFSIDDLMKVKIRDFNWIGSPTLCNGFIAQELELVYPEAVSHPEDCDGVTPLLIPNESDEKEQEIWTVDAGKITPLIIKSVQDQQHVIENQQKLIKALEVRIQQLEDK